MASTFVPRQVFNVSENIPRSYFLGHHRAGLMRMRSMLDSVDHVIECRDFRIPFTSVNPLFEHVLGDKRRTIIYTKRDLAGDRKLAMQKIESQVVRWDQRTSKVFVLSNFSKATLQPFIKYLRCLPMPKDNVTGYRMLIVGMPNVGKSSFVNYLRGAYMGQKALPKVAITGGEPGVTRKVGSPIKILDRNQCGIYVYDTPGVFVPYVADAESMVKFATCGIIKDSLISEITIADYLLYHINKNKRYAYRKYCEPTNDIMELLNAFALKSGCIAKGGLPDIHMAARKFRHMWYQGKFKYFVMDDVLSITTVKRRELQATYMGMFDDEKAVNEEERPTSTMSVLSN
ncbi:Mitochondrial GTPase 1 [Emydomyces testavorans]|uniref:Mitochondrial GTPase 1 n=1 Tax=Emydomyces testavorans TaxID=2070801 RepID=A0AAF0IGT5_9EURO|nr:Mitochondrial GTPase 1 [Emydomyces testavorans]